MSASSLTFDAMTRASHPHRWRLSRAGIQNVWFYYDATFQFSGGRCIWRGVNGAGKSRALELLLPFLLDADRRKMDSTGGGRVRLEDLMKAGGGESGNRVGYMWLELERDTDDGPAHLTLGALVRFSHATAEAKAWYFMTPMRVGVDLQLMDAARSPLSRDNLSAAIGADRITESPTRHRDRVRAEVFGLMGDTGAQRFTALMQLLHTMRAPDVGNRIDEGNLTKILSDALPPLSEAALEAAGTKLDALRETREAQARLAASEETLRSFLSVYRQFTVAELTKSLDTVERAAADARTKADDARAAHELAREQQEALEKIECHLEELRGERARLDGEIDAIEKSEAYKAVQELDGKAAAVERQALAADGAWDALKRAVDSENREVAGADRQADDLAVEVASLDADLRQLLTDLAGVAVPHGQLPASLSVQRTVVPPTAQTWQESHAAPVTAIPVNRPQNVNVLPADLDEMAAIAARVETAARTRADSALHRHTVALEVSRKGGESRAAAERADIADRHAEQTQADADSEAEERDGVAASVGAAWVAWTHTVNDAAVLGDTKWAVTPVADLLADRDALCGDTDHGDDLESLRALPGQLAREPRAAVDRQHGELDAAQRADTALRAGMERDLQELRDGQVEPEPPLAPWHPRTTTGAVPLWRAVDFAEHVPACDRANLESALLAAGILTAQATPAGELVTVDGQVLVAPDGPVQLPNLTDVLMHDQASSADPDLVRDVLARVGLDPATQPVAVSSDGKWRNGPVHGALTQIQARFIGAAARAAERATRIAALLEKLEQLNEADRQRQEVREQLQLTVASIDRLVNAAPAVVPLASARTRAARAQKTAGEAACKAREAHELAEALHRDWQGALGPHRAACAQQDLPEEAGALKSLAGEAQQAAAGCARFARSARSTGPRLEQHRLRCHEIDALADSRKDLLRRAQDTQRDWAELHTELDTLRELLGANREALLTQLEQAREAIQIVERNFTAAGTQHTDQATAVGEARGMIGGAERDAEAAQSALLDALQRALASAQLPGVWQAAAGDVPLMWPTPQMTPTQVGEACRDARAALDGVRGIATGRQIDTAIATLSTALSGAYDVVWELAGEIRTVVLQDGGARTWHVTDALAEVSRALDEGRRALSEKERTVFTTFVLEGVAGELGSRLKQAQQLVEDMAASLRSIRTQQGIGLTVSWGLLEHADGKVRRLRDLVRRGVSVRTPEENDELIDLVKDLVEAQAILDPSTGYAKHLAAALDYRTWHKMDVYILGPNPGQRRAISPRSKLSQGEIRFVSYAALFAAVDAFLTGLPDTDLALRLVVLDDAFAKVDNQVVAQFLGLLVNLDLDFAMTGHGLWGTVAQVPALDVYEVRRGSGPAITTHIHWDGHTRHLHPVTAGS